MPVMHKRFIRWQQLEYTVYGISCLHEDNSRKPGLIVDAFILYTVAVYAFYSKCTLSVYLNVLSVKDLKIKSSHSIRNMLLLNNIHAQK